MLGRGALRRGRRRGRRRTRRRMLMADSLMNQDENNDSYEESPQEEYSEPVNEESPAFSDDDAEQLEKLAELKEKETNIRALGGKNNES